MKIKSPWSKINERNDFKTYFVYTERLATMSCGLSLTCNIKPLLARENLDNIKNKLRLIALTKKSLEDEHRIVTIDKEYSTASVLWLPVKTYYLLYHLLSAIDYILTGDKASLNISHDKCLNIFSERLKNGKIQFSERMFDNVFTKDIFGFRSKSGEHLSHSVTDEVIYKLIMKQIGKRKKDNYKLKTGISLRTKKGREQMDKYLSNKFNVSIFDFFYFMRIKSSYRDFNFINDIPSVNTKMYFEKYLEVSGNFYNCFNNLKNKFVIDILSNKN